ncbi:Glucose--fructose oxidoreductase [Planctomycetales bacterium 10988]|nr:Glucose--fructose oxidoreductase [Planctomycetales bacterium 10988]
MKKVGIVGIGFMGMIHYLAYQRMQSAEVVAINTRNQKRLAGDWRDIQGNFGPAGEMMDLSGIATYADFEEIIKDDSVEVIDLCLPPNLHPEFTIQALEAGKDVIVEKPIALTSADADRMLEAAEQCGQKLLVAHVLPFFPEFQFAYQAAKEGTYGKPVGGLFQRTIADPTWLKDFYDPKTVGGPLVDLHIHDAHFIRLLWGMPKSVRTIGRMKNEVVASFQTQFCFEEDWVVSASGGVIPQQGRPFAHGFELYFEKTTLIFHQSVWNQLEGGNGIPLTLLTEDGKAVRPELGDGDPVLSFVAELEEAMKALEPASEPSLLAGEVARDALLLCEMQTESAVKGVEVSH